MRRSGTKVLRLDDRRQTDPWAPCVGRVVAVTPDGEALVDYPGNPGEPRPARSLVDWRPQRAGSDESPVAVLLLFERADLARPIIVGMLRDGATPATAERRDEVVVDGQTLVFDARQEIVLRCGQASVTLRADGTVLIRGTRIQSRASGTNRIKGATVQIN